MRISDWSSDVCSSDLRGPVESFGPLELSVFNWEGLKSLLLPAATIATAKCALIIRVTRAATRECLPQDYIKFARAKGLRERRVLGVHLLKTILIPIVTIGGLEYGHVFAFAVVTETVFSWPGVDRKSVVGVKRGAVRGCIGGG